MAKNTNTNENGKVKNTKTNGSFQGSEKSRSSYGKKRYKNGLDQEAQRNRKENCVAKRYGEENDPSWYNTVGQLVSDAGSISYYTPAGAGVIGTADEGKATIAFPGIMTFDVMPCPGISRDKTSALNIAALRLYTNMRKKNSGATNYSHADMMMYCMAIDSVFCMYAEMLRLYGTLNLWNQTNRYEPQYVVRALGYDYDDFKDNLANFRAWFNIWIRRANAFSLPVSFTISKRHTWLFSNIWTDSSSAKAQLYIHKPYGYYTWEDTVSDQGTMLQFHTWKSATANTLLTFDEVREYMDNLLNKLWNSEDVAIIGGDLEKAYGAGNLFNLAYCDEAYTCEPVYSEEVLMQIENAMVVGYDAMPTGNDAKSLDIMQNVDENIILYSPHFKARILSDTPAAETTPSEIYLYTLYNLSNSDRLIMNMHFDNPTNDDNMVASRFKFAPRFSVSEGQTGYAMSFDNIGSDFIVGMHAHTLSQGQLSSTEIKPYIMDINDMVVLEQFQAFQLVNYFDWHPCIWSIGYRTRGDKYEWGAAVPLMDVDNYTRIGGGVIDKMNDAAIYNLWDIPVLG